MADRPEMFAPTRGCSGMADSMEPCTMLLWQRHFGKFGLFSDKIAHESSCMPDTPDMFGPTSADDQRHRRLLPRQRHLRQARSLIAYRLVCLLTPRLLGVYYFLSLTLSVCMYVCLSVTLIQKSILLCFSMEFSHFLVISSP